MLSRFDIEVILYDEVERRKNALGRVRKAFDEVVSSVPSGLPSPDGSLRISNARRLESAARCDYMIALRELTRFVIDGEIPERLREKGDSLAGD
jgi:hypothetical protein